MRNYFKEGFEAIKKVLLQDSVNLYLISFTIILAVVNFAVWKLILSSEHYFIYNHLGIFPLRYYVIILILNTSLALFAYEKEKEMTYLFLSANVMLGIFLFILELFYFFQGS